MKPNFYRYSYSGADTKVFCWVTGYPETYVELESVHTISVSVHEQKGQARALGYRSPKGLSRGVRTIAGSMIFNVIEEHPLAPILEKCRQYNLWSRGWSMDASIVGTGTLWNTLDLANRLITLLPPLEFGMIAQAEASAYYTQRYSLPMQETSESVRTITVREENFDRQVIVGPGRENRTYAEYTNLAFTAAGSAIGGVDFIDMGTVSSANDIVTEITASFIAMRYYPITLNTLSQDGLVEIPTLFEDKTQYLLQKELFPVYNPYGAEPVVWSDKLHMFDQYGDLETVPRRRVVTPSVDASRRGRK